MAKQVGILLDVNCLLLFWCVYQVCAKHVCPRLSAILKLLGPWTGVLQGLGRCQYTGLTECQRARGWEMSCAGSEQAVIPWGGAVKLAGSTDSHGYGHKCVCITTVEVGVVHMRCSLSNKFR